MKRTRRNSGSIKLADVARMAGVAPITASRALRNPKWVSTETLDRVREAVARTGYVPNLLAGGLASSRSNLVVTIVPTISSPMFAPTVDALIDRLNADGYEVMLGVSGYSSARQDRLLHEVLQRRPAGVVVTGVVQSEESRRRLIAARIPVVETWDLTDNPIGMVAGYSSEKVGAEVARYLHGRGRRRLAVITGDDRRAIIRAGAFVATARELGLLVPPICSVKAPSSLEDGRRSLADLLARFPDVDGIACSTDILALGVTTEAQARGIGIPTQIAVIGFGDLAYSQVANPPLTTVRIDGEAIGRVAARYILAAGQPDPLPDVTNGRIVDVGFTIVERGSA